MNKVLQGVLVLDTETSKELKKGGSITIVLSDLNVKLTYDKENKIVTCEQTQVELGYMLKPKDKLILNDNDIKELEENGKLTKGKNTYLLKDKEAKTVTIASYNTIDKVVYR